MNYDNYKNKMPYPKKPSKKCPKCNISFEIDDNFCSNCGQELKNYFETCMKYYKEEQKNYKKKEIRLFELFKQDALEYVGLSNHPKKDKIFSFAWENGHSSGYRNVVAWLEEILDIV